MAIFSSLLQVIFPLLHERDTKHSHFSVFSAQVTVSGLCCSVLR